tara:strand:- start:5291 stop:6274 length:984 start_codon:yes stop_codon:yes gene_type:complete
MIVKSTKLAEVKSALANLKTNKVYSIQEIVDTIKQVCNHKNDTYKHALVMKSGDYNVGGNCRDLDTLYVDLTYQRKIRLAKIITKLIENGGFCINVAGTIDVAYRPSSDRYFVWDGFRRCLMVGMCGGKKVGVHMFEHNHGTTEIQARMLEARFFKIRNAEKENMSPEEIFKSEVVYEDPTAMAQLSLLKDCGLDVEGLNPDGVVLGGFRPFVWCFNNISHDNVIYASEVIQSAWKASPQVLAYLLGGLSKLLEINDSNFYDRKEILDAFFEFADINKMQDLTNPRLNSKPYPSIALNIANKVLKNDNGLIQEIKDEFTDEEIEALS